MSPIHAVVDPSNPALSDYRAVSAPTLAVERGFFVAEGRLIVQRAIQTQPLAVRSLLLNQAAFAALEASLALLPTATPIYLAREGMFEALTGIDVHRGCLALVDRPSRNTVADLSTGKLLVALEHCGNPDNLGGVFRNAAAFAVQGVVLSPGCCDPLYRKSIRTSMGAVLTVPWATAVEWPDALGELRARGFVLVALTPHASSSTLDEFSARPRPDRLALLFGSEGDGLSQAALAMADHALRIPMAPDVDSLNLAVSTGIVLSRLSGPSISGTR